MIRITYLLGLMFSVTMQANESNEFDYFAGLSSQKHEERVEAINLLEALPETEQVKILRNVYVNVDNGQLLGRHDTVSYLVYSSLKSISSVKSKALEQYVYAEINKMLDREELDPETTYKVPWFGARLKYYISTLPYITLDGDQSFDTILRFIKLYDHNRVSRVGDGLHVLSLTPYQSDNRNLIDLFEVLSYHNDYQDFAAPLQHLTKVFERYINQKNHVLFIEHLSEHIAVLKGVRFQDNLGGRQAYLLERISFFEKLVFEYTEKYKTKKIPVKRSSALIKDVQNAVSHLSSDLTVPVFYGRLPADGPERQAYDNKIKASTLTKPVLLGDIKYQLGMSRFKIEGIENTAKDMALYVLISNGSDKDQVVDVSFEQMNSAGFIIDKINLSNNAVINHTEQQLIGTRLSGLSVFADEVRVTVETRDANYVEPETPMYIKAILQSVDFTEADFAFKKERLDLTGEHHLGGVPEILKQNRGKLTFDLLSKNSCGDKYKETIERLWSAKSSEQYLLYKAKCQFWDGEGTTGYSREVLYQFPLSMNKTHMPHLVLVNNEGARVFQTIESINDINNDGEIELVVREVGGVSSAQSFQKLKNGEMVTLVHEVNYSEGGHFGYPLYRNHPFVYTGL